MKTCYKCGKAGGYIAPFQVDGKGKFAQELDFHISCYQAWVQQRTWVQHRSGRPYRE